MKNEIKGIVFDCDGVILDSEVLACAVAAEALQEQGYSITTDEYIDRFMGKSFEEAQKIILEESGIDISDKEKLRLKEAKRKQIFEEQLQIIPGIDNVLKELEKMNIPFCIASGSSFDRLMHSLEVTKLLPFFRDRIFSAELVKNPKPAPDIFLYAADKIGVKPENCLVIEDGYHGARGAIAARMQVLGFTGASHMNEDRIKMLEESGVNTLFSNMEDLLTMI